MGQKFFNTARSALSAGINAAVTTFTVLAGQGDRFPVANVDTGSLPSADDWFKVVLTDVTGAIEIVHVRTRAGGSDIFSNVIRGREGTTARDWGVGSVVGLRLTAEDIETSLNAALTLSTQVADLADQVGEIVANNAVPPGSLIDWPAATPPAGWFVRNGQAVSRSENPGLFALIGTNYGVGNGTTTFNVPDDVTGNRFVRAAGGALTVGTVQENENKSHGHTGSTGVTGNHTHTENRVNTVGTATYNIAPGSIPIAVVNTVSSGSVNTSTAGNHNHTVAVDASGGTESRPNSRAYLPLIKGG